MKMVKVSFELEANAPDHHTGLTDEIHKRVWDAIDSVGGYDIEFEVFEVDHFVSGRPKPKKPE